MVEKKIFTFLLCGNESFFVFFLSPSSFVLAQSTQRGNWVLFACTDTILFHDDVKLYKRAKTHNFNYEADVKSCDQ